MTELQILSAVKNSGGSIQYTALLSLNVSDTHQDALADKARIEKMIKDNLLSGKTEAYGSISITNPGRMYLQNAAYLEDISKQRDKEYANIRAEEKRHNKFLRITTLISLGIAAVTLILTLIDNIVS